MTKKGFGVKQDNIIAINFYFVVSHGYPFKKRSLLGTVRPSIHKERLAIFFNLGMLEFLHRFQTFKDYSLSSLVPSLLWKQLYNQYQNISPLKT